MHPIFSSKCDFIINKHFKGRMQFSKDMEWFCNKIVFFFIFVDITGSSHFCDVYFYNIYVINQDFQFLHWSLSLRVFSVLLRSSYDCHKITSSCHILTLSLHKFNPVKLIQENLSTAGSCSSCWLYSGVRHTQNKVLAYPFGSELTQAFPETGP